MLAMLLIIATLNILGMHRLLLHQGQDFRHVIMDAPWTKTNNNESGGPAVSFQDESAHGDANDDSLTSGVGIVTKDGLWGNRGKDKYVGQDVKILGFTDRHYLPIAELWYNRLSSLVSCFSVFIEGALTYVYIRPNDPFLSTVQSQVLTPTVAAATIAPAIFLLPISGLYRASCRGQ